MKKRILAALLALCLALALVPTGAFAADSDFAIEGGKITKRIPICTRGLLTVENTL